MDHNEAPVLDALAEYHRLDRYGFTPPGHRQGRGADERVSAVLGGALREDVLATAGLDDRKSSNGYLSKAEELMADAVGADRAFFSTCGSSLSVKAAILAVTRGEGELLIGRDAHKSTVAGLVLSGLQPRWVPTRYDEEQHIAHPPGPEEYERMWQRYPDASAAVVTSPTPYGTCADLRAIVDICHSRGKPIIVDEAWGAHLPFHDHLPTWAMDVGADLCVVSVHRMGIGFEQGSVYHLQGSLVDPVRLAQCADVLATTSSNVLLYAAIDGWRRQMVQHGRQLLGDALALTQRTRDAIERLPGLHVLRDELLAEEASHDLDPMHVLIDVSELGVSGYQVADWLRSEHRIDVGLNDHRRIEATLSIADDEATTGRLLDALSATAGGCGIVARAARGLAAVGTRSAAGHRPAAEGCFLRSGGGGAGGRGGRPRGGGAGDAVSARDTRTSSRRGDQRRDRGLPPHRSRRWNGHPRCGRRQPGDLPGDTQPAPRGVIVRFGPGAGGWASWSTTT